MILDATLLNKKKSIDVVDQSEGKKRNKVVLGEIIKKKQESHPEKSEKVYVYTYTLRG